MKKATELHGLEKQDAYLTQVHSVQLFCPCCHGTHSYIEVRGSSNWAVEIPDENIKCPTMNKRLVHNSDPFGEYWFSEFE